MRRWSLLWVNWSSRRGSRRFSIVAGNLTMRSSPSSPRTGRKIASASRDEGSGRSRGDGSGLRRGESHVASLPDAAFSTRSARSIR